MTKEEKIAIFSNILKEYEEAATEACKGDKNPIQDKIETFALVMTMSTLYENRITELEVEVKKLAEIMGKVWLSVENLALQTTNNQVETKKALDAIKTGVLDTNLAMKYHNK